MKKNPEIINTQKPAKLQPAKRAKGAGLRKGQTNNPNGRPTGSGNKASASVKDIIAKFMIDDDISAGKHSQLRLVLNALKLDPDKFNGKSFVNELSDLDIYKINTSLKYLRFIAPFARDEGELDSENKIKNALFEKFFGVKKE